MGGTDIIPHELTLNSYFIDSLMEIILYGFCLEYAFPELRAGRFCIRYMQFTLVVFA